MKKGAVSEKSPRPPVRERLRRVREDLISLEDSPHHIALGVGIGTFVAYQPIVGFQMIVGAIACRLLRANVVASLPMAWITNPFTIVPIYYMTYKLGVVFTGGSATYEDIKGIFEAIEKLGFWEGATQGYGLLVDIFWPMIVGGTIVGVVNGLLFYLLTLRSVGAYQKARGAE